MVEGSDSVVKVRLEQVRAGLVQAQSKVVGLVYGSESPHRDASVHLCVRENIFSFGF